MIDRVRVLLVEDDPADARWVQMMLGEDADSGFELLRASTLRDGLEVLATQGSTIDAVLLDLSLPDEVGMNTLQRVLPAAHTAVVLVMTGQGDEQTGLWAMQAGAQDYLVKGQVDGRLLRRALRFALERQSVLQRLSHRDDLTGLHNRRGFMMQGEQMLRSIRRQRTPFVLLFMDLDQLKVINDTFGHGEGNRAIIEAAEVLRRCFRQSDLLARFGGDEFAALTVGEDRNDALVRAKVEGAVRAANLKPDRDYTISFSIGVLPCSPHEDGHLEELLERADQLMYREKRLKADFLSLAQGPISAA